MLRPADGPAQPVGALNAGVTVLGQWKPARSLDPLEQLAADPEWDGRRRIYGRGWPAVEGWRVNPQFQPEEALDAAISRATCVLLPYQHYYQSDIAMRCLERLTPVVGREHPFLAELFGAEWPGMVRDEDWVAAVKRVQTVSDDELVALRDNYWTTCVARWQEFADSLTDHAG
jgi:hypothetical protein